MPTVRVHLLAKELGMETKDLIILLNKMGIGGEKPKVHSMTKRSHAFARRWRDKKTLGSMWPKKQ
jgi:hypothetical protein